MHRFQQFKAQGEQAQRPISDVSQGSFAAMTADIADAAVGVNRKLGLGCRVAGAVLQSYSVFQCAAGRTEAIWFSPFGVDINVP